MIFDNCIFKKIYIIFSMCSFKNNLGEIFVIKVIIRVIDIFKVMLMLYWVVYLFVNVCMFFIWQEIEEK